MNDISLLLHKILFFIHHYVYNIKQIILQQFFGKRTRQGQVNYFIVYYHQTRGGIGPGDGSKSGNLFSINLIKSFCGGPGGGFLEKNPLAAGGFLI